MFQTWDQAGGVLNITSLRTAYHSDGAARVEDEDLGLVAGLAAHVADVHRRVAPQILGHVRAVHRRPVRLSRR